MRRFELVDGSSSKFWQIELNGSMFTVVYGRIGTAGQRQEKTFDDDATAKKEYDKLVAEKAKKGYVETGDAPAVTTTATKTTAATTAKPAPKAAKPKATKVAAEDEAPEVETTTPAKAAATTTTTTTATTTTAPPTPKAAPSAAQENAIFWTDALRKRVMPRPGGVEVKVAPLPAEAKSLAVVQKAVDDRSTSNATILPKDKGAEQLKRVEAAVATGSTLSVDDASFLIAWCGSQADYRIPYVFDEVIEWLAASISLPATTAAVLTALERSIVAKSSTSRAGETVPMELLEVAAVGWNAGFAEGGSMRGLDRLRELLVVTHPDARAKSLEAAAALRATENQRVATSFLFPERQDWVQQDIALLTTNKGYRCLLASITDPSILPAGTTFQVDDVIPHRYQRASAGGDMAATLLDGCGLAVAPLFAATMPAGYENSDINKLWYSAVGAVGDDATIGKLVILLGQKEAQAALADATIHQPRRVLRLLASAAAARGKAGEPARGVLGLLVRRSPEVVAEVLPHLSPDGAKAVNAIVAEAGEAVADAADTDIPAFLLAPPWHGKKAKAAGPVHLDLQVKPVPPSSSWAKQEREKWEVQKGWDPTERTAAEWKTFASGTSAVDASDFASAATEHIEQLASRAQKKSWFDDRWYPRIVARHDVKGLPYYRSRLSEDLARFLPFLVPIGVDELALPMATALATKKTLRDAAKSWLLRHPAHAVSGLLPVALGKANKDREYAEGALRFLANSGHEDTVVGVADDNGVKASVQAVLSASPLDKYPAKLPKLPAYADANALPRPVLTDKKGALSVAATTALLEVLMFSPVDDVYAGIEIVKAACEPKSLARFVWALFQAWLVNGAPSKEGFALTAVGFFGDDEAARKLAAYAREWPGEAAHARAVTALEVLATIGTDVALMHLNAIALKSKFKGLQTKAQEKIEVIAETRGLSREELEDRLAPDLGLDDDGSLKLDFGSRVFTVGFDEALRPFVKDHEGARLKELPKPKQTDDEEKAKAAVELWGQLKKDAKQAASLQILRLEMAMCGMRRFPAADFNELFVQHPLVVHIVRRLVWATYDSAGKLTGTFRVAEDRTFADANDDTFVVADDATVGIPHPLELSDTVSGQWSQVFGDYELVQPFAQLGRPTATPDAAQKASKTLDTVKDVTVKTGKLLGLETRRWRRGAPQDGGVVGWMEKHLVDGRVILLDLDPGLYSGMLSESPEQKLGRAVISDGNSYWGGISDKGDAFGTLDAITYSELVRDLEGLRG